MDAKLEVTNLITPFINSIKTISDEFSHLTNAGLDEYLHQQTDKYYLTNTFLHRGEKVRFSDVYFPVSIKYKKLDTNFNKPFDIIDEYKFITISGSAGSGKSTLVKHIFLKSIKERNFIPIIIELRAINEYKGDISSLIFEKILMNKLKPSLDILRRALKNGKFLFLLDGYDEIFSIHKQKIIRDLENFIDEFSENKFIITTRPGSGIEAFHRFHNFTVNKLNQSEVEKFIYIMVKEEERRKRIISAVSSERNNDYMAYLSNPLLLSMFILAFESHPEIPNRKNAFYRNVFDTLYSKHDGVNKFSFLREKKSGLQRDDFEKLLKSFSFIGLSNGHYSFTYEYLYTSLCKVVKSLKPKVDVDFIIEDLQMALSILILDGFEYSFPHRSLQEYFAAQFISDLPTDKKRTAYEKVLNQLTENSNDSSFNLWSLCDELDKTHFTINFLIPHLESIRDLLEQETVKDRYDSCITTFSLSIIHDQFLTENQIENQPPYYKKTIGIFMPYNFNQLLCEYCQIYFDNSVSRFLSRNEIDEIFILRDDIHTGVFDFRFLYEDSVASIMIRHGFVDIFDEVVEQITIKLSELKIEISKEKVNIDELLDL